MSFEIEFLKLAEIYNEHLDEHNQHMSSWGLNYSPKGYYDDSDTYLDNMVPIKYILELVYERDLSKSPPYIKKIRENWLKAIEFMKPNITEGLLSEDKFVRNFAEQLYIIESKRKKEEIRKQNLAWMKKKD